MPQLSAARPVRTPTGPPRSGGARSPASKSHLRRPRSSRRWPPRKQTKSTPEARTSPSSRTPGSNNAVVYGSSAVAGASTPAWKRCGLVSATTSSAGSGCERAHMHNCKRLSCTTHPETSTSEPPRTHEPTPSRIQKPLLDRSNQFLHSFPSPSFLSQKPKGPTAQYRLTQSCAGR
jgi:hypothetical protein